MSNKDHHIRAYQRFTLAQDTAFDSRLWQMTSKGGKNGCAHDDDSPE